MKKEKHKKEHVKEKMILESKQNVIGSVASNTLFWQLCLAGYRPGSLGAYLNLVLDTMGLQYFHILNIKPIYGQKKEWKSS